MMQLKKRRMASEMTKTSNSGREALPARVECRQGAEQVQGFKCAIAAMKSLRWYR